MNLTFLYNTGFITFYYLLFLIMISFSLIRNKRTFILVLIFLLMNIILLLGIEYFQFTPEKLLLRIYQSLCMFFGALDYQSILNIAKDNIYYDHFRLIIPLQFIVSILYSITFTVSYFSFLLDRTTYYFLRKNIYIFSHLNPQSITLAKSLCHSCNIVFCNVDEDTTSLKTYAKELKQIHALFIDKSIKDISLKKNANVFLISDDDITNIHLLDQISTRIEKNNITIYPFIKQRNHEIYADSTVELKTSVKVINEVDLIIYDILFTQPPLPNNNHIDILIIGAGKIGTRFLKALYWYCTYPDVNITVTVITPHRQQTIHELSCDCPAIFNDSTKQTNNTYVIRHLKKIKFEQFDVRNSDFINYIDNNQWDYYFVALGDDNLNAQISIRIRQILSQHFYTREMCFSKPIITIIMDPNLNNIITNMKTFADIKNPETIFYNYHIDCYGRYDQIYSSNKIMNNPLLKAGTKVFANREKKDETPDNNKAKTKTNDFQCNHRSNIAFILHIQCKLHILKKNKYKLVVTNDRHKAVSFNSVIKNNLNNLAEIEHERWRCFYETEGFQYVDDATIDQYKPDFGLKNYLAKLHPALCDQQKLFDRKNRYKTNYIENDKNLISNVDEIITNELMIIQTDEENH